VTTQSIAAPAEVLAFWLGAGPDKWYRKDESFDAEIRARFLPTYEAAVSGRLADWEASAEGALALLIVLDQFPRNMFRGSARIYAADPQARTAAARAIDNGFDQRYTVPERRFFYMPLMHSEDLADHERCIALCRAAGDADGLWWAEHHADISRRFGRFPHRNTILGRATRAEEQAFIDGGGFAG
jgi:uncharacterized protein (DUF924 family)